MPVAELVALLGDSIVGQVRRDSRGRLSFAYAPEWADAEGAYRLTEVGTYEWDKLARELKLRPRYVRSSIARITGAATELTMDVLRRERRLGLSHPILETLAHLIIERARRLGTMA